MTLGRHAAATAACEANRKSWRPWVDNAFNDGAGAAHRYLQDPQDSKSEAVDIGEGVLPRSPLDALTVEAEEWAGQWRAHE